MSQMFKFCLVSYNHLKSELNATLVLNYQFNVITTDAV